MKKYSVILTSQQVKSMLNSLSEEFKNSNHALIARLNEIIIEDDYGKIQSKGENSDRKNTSKGQSGIFSLYKRIYPNNRVKQEAEVELVIDEFSRQKCRFDIVDHDLKIVIEINGSHHEKFNSFYHKNIDKFKEQQKRDNSKKLWCKQSGWTYVEMTDVYARKLCTLDFSQARKVLCNQINKAIQSTLV